VRKTFDVANKLTLGDEGSADEIRTWITRRIAYALWEQRGAPAGDEWTDWLTAEQMLRARQLGDAGAEALAECPDLSSYSELDLEGHAIGDRGAQALAGSPYLAGLRELELRNNPIGDAGARALAESPHAAVLKKLKLSSSCLSEETQSLLRARFKRRLKLD